MEEIKTEDKKYIIEYDNLMKEWNWDRNNELGLLPEKITYGSTKSGEVIQGVITQGIIQPHMIENNNIKGDKECNINYLTNL